MVKKLILFFLIISFLFVLVGGVGIVYGYHYYARDLPQIDTVEDYQMQSVTTILAADETVVAEFFDEQRYPVKISKIPKYARNAFLAAEDASFYDHQGIDPISILRAFIKNVQSGTASQGGSTITQQVVKNILLSSEKKLDRKIKEAILAYRLEKKLSKDDILELYLNKIFFGNRSYGIQAAAKNYFHKDVSELTLAESAILAGLPQAPSRYSPVNNFDQAKRRQEYVLSQMVNAGFITGPMAKQAKAETVQVFRASNDRIYTAPYYVSEVRRRFEERWPEIDIDRDGVKIYTALDVKAYNFAQEALRKGLREVDKRQGWRGPIAHVETLEEFIAKYESASKDVLELDTNYPAFVSKIDAQAKKIEVDIGKFTGVVSLKNASWANKQLRENGSLEWINALGRLSIGDVIEVAVKQETQDSGAVKQDFVLDQTPAVQGAVVLVDPHTGKVPVVIGGYDYQVNQFNRATQGKRQPGSSFKPVIYLAALDGFGFTPSTIIQDVPRTYKVGEGYWSPSNYDKDYLGPITLRTALERSRNLISADIISRIGVDSAIRYARKLGFESDLGRNLSLSLGSSEVSPLEVTRAYGVFAAGGVLFPTAFISRIEDAHGNSLYDFETERLQQAEQTVRKESAFLMAHLMKGVVQHGTGYRVRVLERPIAAKTGTSNDQMDAWFVGYTPEWAAGVWVGFDEKKSLGPKETGGKVAAPVWLYFMQEFLGYRDQIKYERLIAESKEEAARLGIDFVEPEAVEPLDFSIPEGVEPYWINKKSGVRSARGEPGAFLEYFIKGTKPIEQVYEERVTNYWDLPEY